MMRNQDYTMTRTHKTVLIVEDSPAQALALEHLLKEEGLQVLWASNGRSGVTMAQQHAPDVIVLDIEMPEMNGFEACRCLKENPQTTDIPIVMLTVRDETAMAMRGIDVGATDFIPKDAFSGPVLLETLRQLHILPGSGSGVQIAEDDCARD
jgi:CheY-like chemotaxis protein